MLTNTGLFGKANKAVDETKKAQALEDVQLKINEGQLKYNGQLTLKSLTSELIEDKKNNYSVTTESKEDDPDAEKLEDTSDITKDTEAIYVTNEKYGYEVKVSKLLSSSLTNPIQTSSNDESEETGTKKTIREEISDLKAEVQELASKNEELTTEIGNLKNADNNGNSLSAYPVGSIYMSINNKNPGEIFGGTWETWGTGRVPVSVNTADSNFNTVEKTGGESSHTLTSAESGQKNLGTITSSANNRGHSHTFSGSTSTNTAYNSGTAVYGTGGSTNFIPLMWGGSFIGGDARVQDSLKHSHTFSGTTSGENQNHTHTITISGSNASSAHNNLQPYITCYMWKRTN